MQAPQRLAFGSFYLDLRDERLWGGPEVVRLPPKCFAVLRCLVAQAGRLVTKDALLATVWPETVVSEDVLTVAIRQLRRVLGDRVRTPRFIKTVHGRGYRFIAPVSALASSEGSTPMGPPRPVPPPLFRRPPHFVGQDTALAQLAQWWTTARQDTRQVGMIVGAPGIGKTALVVAFLAQAAATEDVWVGHGQCIDHYGAGEAYLPVLEALGRLGRDAEGERLVACLRHYAPSWLVQMPALLPSSAWEALQRTSGEATPTLLAEALTAFATSGRGDMLAEAYRLQGTLLLRQAVPDVAQAEACFQQALAIARRQQAKSWELRVAMSLARLWQHQGKRAEAHALLEGIYTWFTEGFDTADLREAKALLEALV